MYDIKWIREHPDTFDNGLRRRGLEPLSKKLIELDEKRRAAIGKSEQAQARRNAASKEIGAAKAKKDEATAAALMAEVATLKETMPGYEKAQADAVAELDKKLAQIPNLPLDEVPDGADEHGNVEKHTFGAKREYAFKPKEHFDLGAALGMMDFELAAKLSGARFVVLQRGLARMERALGQFFLDVHTSDEHGYTEVNPPLMVHSDAMFGTAQLPKFEEDQFEVLAEYRKLQLEFQDKLARYQERHVANELLSDVNRTFDSFMKPAIARGIDASWAEKPFRKLSELFNSKVSEFKAFASEFKEFQREFQSMEARDSGRLWLIPTAEVPLTNLVRESIVDENTLPRRYTACTPCFRAEAGAAGRDTRGMIRQHQFTKVELVSITTPEESKAEHERMLACAEEVLKKLDLHYRVITLCTGDMGFASQKTYDIEVWLPGQNMYREISSCSVCGDFQARRMNARYRGKDGKPAFVHTLNGSGVAVGRALIAVMETYQQEDGSIVVPDVLKPYMGGMTKIEKAK
jgi:seryl-tRNA synthetase